MCGNDLTEGIVWVPYGAMINGVYYQIDEVTPPSPGSPYWRMVQGESIMEVTGEVTVFYKKGGTLTE